MTNSTELVGKIGGPGLRDVSGLIVMSFSEIITASRGKLIQDERIAACSGRPVNRDYITPRSFG